MCKSVGFFSMGIRLREIYCWKQAELEDEAEKEGPWHTPNRLKFSLIQSQRKVMFRLGQVLVGRIVHD
jgi:hypothetical protein